MNMYAIMTGALFVAFYSVYAKGNCDKRLLCVKSWDSNFDGILLVLIALLGFLCSLCWLGAVKGHYEWMKSFIKILNFNEKNYFDRCGLFVYSKIAAPKGLIPLNENYLPGFYSTQKFTLFFIKGVIFAWLFGILLLLCRNFYWAFLGVIISFVYLRIRCLKARKILKDFHSEIKSNQVVNLEDYD